MEKKKNRSQKSVVRSQKSEVRSLGLKGRAHGSKSSVLWPFILGCCDMGGNYSVNVKDLYDHYRETVTIGITHGQDAKVDAHSLSFKDFEEELRKALPFIGKEKRRPERRMYFTGIRLREKSELKTIGCRLKADREEYEKIEGAPFTPIISDSFEEGVWASNKKHIPPKIVKELADKIKKNNENGIEKYIASDFKSNDMLKEPMELKGQVNVKSPIEMQIDELEKQVNALNDGMRVLGIRVIPVSAYDDEISNTYPADFKENDKTPENNRSRVFNRLDLLLSKVAWIATVQKRIEELLEI